MAIDFEKVLKKKKGIVWKEIQKYLRNPLPLSGSLKIPDQYAKDAALHWRIISDYPQRQGKYLRPTLLILTAEAMGISQEQTVKTAAAMQTSEDWILIHDDFEDDSLARRGKPTLHRIYGPELAVNAGDALQTMMWKMLCDNREVLGPEKTFALLDEFYLMLTRTILGQTAEINWTQKNREDLSDQDCLFIIDGKTVYYTIAGPMRLGAIIADASRQQLNDIYKFAQPLGRCFQIRDDLLDLVSDFRGLKRQVGNDIYEGKRTIMLAHLFRTAKKKDQTKLAEIMNKTREQKSPEEVDFVIELMKKYGSLNYGQKLAEESAKKALEIFEEKLGFLSCSPAREELRAGIDFILERNY